jgi:hypothetical protein
MSPPIIRKPHIIANAIRMKRSQDSRTFLLLEGNTDQRIFNKFIDSNKCKIEIAYGRGNLIQVIENLNESIFDGFLGIVDADEWYLTEKIPEIKNLLITEAHDIECLILSSNAFVRFLEEFALNAKLQVFCPNLIEKLLESSLPIGYLRCFSIADNLDLNFDKCYNIKDFEKLLDVQTLNVDVSSLINIINEWSPSPRIANKKKLATKILTYINEKKLDPWLICNGNDMICILTIGLVNIFGNDLRGKHVDAQIVDGTLRLTYSFSDFQKSKIYASIKKWEINNAPFEILA